MMSASSPNLLAGEDSGLLFKVSDVRSFGVRVFCVLSILSALNFACQDTASAESPSTDNGAEAVSSFPPARWHRASGAPPGVRYVGSAVCAGCHSDVAQEQAKTSMRKTSTHGENSSYLSTHAILRYREGKFSITIERKKDQVIYSVSDGNQSLSVPIKWAFGVGAGQTYILEYEKAYYESRVSFYRDINGLGLTLGHDPKPVTTLSACLGRLLSQDEENKCFPCHTSEGVLDGKLQPDRMKPGVTCENCHGPGSQHIDAINNRDWKHLHIFNPGRLRTGEVNDFCGTCHRSTREVAVAGIFGIRNVRFQPYRLEGSRCYDANDKRITCLACHDPHVQLVTDIQSYDSKCLACHVLRGQVGTASRTAPPCPRADKSCASCHMPKLTLPGAHHKFADHQIRIYRAAEKYPN